MGPPYLQELLVGDGRSCPVELGKVDGELFVKCLRLVLQEADRSRLPQYHRHVAVATPVNSGVDPMTEGNVVRELVQLAIYRDLIPIRTCVGHQRKPILCWQKGIRDHEITVEEEFQNGNASARNNTVARRVRGVCRRALGKRLRKQVAPIFVETALQGLRLQDIVVENAVDAASLAGLDQLDDSASRLRAMTAVDKPLLVPTASQRPASHFTEHPRKVRPPESAEANLRPRVAVHAAWVRRRSDGVKYKERHEISLVEHIRVGPGGEVSPAMLEAQLRIVLVLQTGAAAILDEGPGGGIGQIVHVLLVGHLLLADGLLAEERRRNEELGEVWPYRFTREGAPEQQVRGDLASIPRARVVRQPRKFPCRLCGHRTRGVLHKRDVTQQGSPIQFDQFRSVGSAGQCGRRRDNHDSLLAEWCRYVAELLGIATLQVEGQPALRISQLTSAAQNDVFEVLRVPAVQRGLKALVRIQIHPPGAVLQKGFGIGPALVVIAPFVAVCRVRWYRNASLGLRGLDADFRRFLGAFGSPQSAISVGSAG